MMKWIIEYEKIDLNKMNESYLFLIKNIKFESKETYVFNKYINETNINTFLMVKSWRSNVLEGNTTKKKKLSSLIKNSNRNLSEIRENLIAPSLDEELEILNLHKIYQEDFNYKVSSSQRVNYILGENILHNDFDKFRGKLKLEENHIVYKRDKEFTIYEINFAFPNIVKKELNKLFEFLNLHIKNNLSLKEVIILATIFNIEFNRIHPFADGNGRTSRYFFEKIFEDNNFLPLIFSTSSSKKKYKEFLLNCDINFYLTGKKYDYKDLILNMMEIYEQEIKELIKLIKEI